VLLPQTTCLHLWCRRSVFCYAETDFFNTIEINFWFQRVNTVPVANLMLGLVCRIHVRWHWQVLMLPGEWSPSWRSSSWYHLRARTTPPIWYRIWRHQNMYSKSKTLCLVIPYLHWCATVLNACSLWYVHLCQLQHECIMENLCWSTYLIFSPMQQIKQNVIFLQHNVH